VRLSIVALGNTSNANVTTDFDQGFEPQDARWPEAEYGNFPDALASISASDQKVFLPFEKFPMEITKAPITEIVCFVSSFAQFNSCLYSPCSPS
jgi:hypothetical protein